MQPRWHMNIKQAVIIFMLLVLTALIGIDIAVRVNFNKPKGATEKNPFSFSRELVKKEPDKQAPF